MTIAEAIDHLGLKEWRIENPRFLSWPPDVFGLAAWLLRESGAYRMVVARNPTVLKNLKPEWIPRNGWHAQVEKIGAGWGRDISPGPPGEVVQIWRKFRNAVLHADAPPRLANVAATGLWQPLQTLLAIADTACRQVGLPKSHEVAESQDDPDDAPAHSRRPMSVEALIKLYECLERHELGRASDSRHPEKARVPTTLCRDIPPDRALVLPKMRTPQTGLTIRSMSHHLALYSGAEITPVWMPTRKPNPPPVAWESERSRTYNVLVVPYPYSIRTTQFVPHVVRQHQSDSPTPFFSFDHQPLDLTPKRLESLVEEASARVGRLHGMIFPEAAMSDVAAASLFGERGVPFDLDFLVCGVTTSPKRGELGRNEALVRIRDVEGWREFHQAKHHRWKLTEDQVRMYHASGALNPRVSWWEAIELRPRTLRFVELASDCVFSVLICEDLARPDPVGDLVRAVGPNLVIALLQDGPQMNARWPGRFAGVLADDPGSAVLTVTSLGMCELSRPMDRLSQPASRVVAMWRDPIRGVQEVTLPQGHHAVVLTVVQQDIQEYSGDGRDDGNTSTALVLGGVQTLAFPAEPAPASPKRRGR